MGLSTRRHSQRGGRAEMSEEMQPLTGAADQLGRRQEIDDHDSDGSDAADADNTAIPTHHRYSDTDNGATHPVKNDTESETTPARMKRRISSESEISDSSFVFHGIGLAVAQQQQHQEHEQSQQAQHRRRANMATCVGDPDDREANPTISSRDTAGWRQVKRRGCCVVVAAAVTLAAIAVTVFASLHRPLARPTAVGMPESFTATWVEKGQEEGKKIELDRVLDGSFRPVKKQVSWFESADDRDGLLLKRNNRATAGEGGGAFLTIESVELAGQAAEPAVLMKSSVITVGPESLFAEDVWPSPDLKKVLVLTDRKRNWRYSFIGRYWIVDVESQKAVPLDPDHSTGLGARVRLASWAPTSDAISFTREADMNVYVRLLNETKARQITKDGGTDLFYGVPDWMYEEEVLMDRVATWWAPDGNRIAFLRTNETMVPSYPVEFFIDRPSGTHPPQGMDRYPDVQQIKYPKAGAPNPVVAVEMYDLKTGRMASPAVADGTDFADDNRIVVEVLWAGPSTVVVHQTDRQSEVKKVVVIDAHDGSASVVRSKNVTAIDGGWVENSHSTFFVPANSTAGRAADGYIDLVPVDGYNHLALFSPVTAKEPLALLTSGSWEVIDGPTAVDVDRNIVYFFATRDGSMSRHLYSVSLELGPDGKAGPVEAVTNTSTEATYSVSFSAQAGFMLLSYDGPTIPWQKIMSVPASGRQDRFEQTIEDNKSLSEYVAQHALPTIIRGTITIDGLEMNVVERRPANFNPIKKYPVLFHMYQGPGSQKVDTVWGIDFQSYIAASLGYVVVTLDGRGTGFVGRPFRSVVRGQIGIMEARDQIAAAKEWSHRSYVNPDKMAIWGWSYGGFTTLKTLELDGGETFRYGMAVAPVTDWALYDSIYTERFMRTPQNNPDGYHNSSITDVDRLGQNVRFLVMHGVADDNVHMQNTLVLADKLDQAGISNYDMHVFPDSNHGIYFHNANSIVFHKLRDWIVNAFNGEWVKTQHPEPNPLRKRQAQAFAAPS